MAQITKEARTKEEEVGRARGRKIKGRARATHNSYSPSPQDDVPGVTKS